MPLISRDFINDLLARVDIVELINKRVPLKKAGRDFHTCCPFHEEKTPSFTVSPTKQFFYCFGCGAAGTAFDFVARFDHLDFPGAVEQVANESGIDVIYDEQSKPQNPAIDRYKNLLAEVADDYAGRLGENLQKNHAADYLHKNRGINSEIAERFNLGFAPAGWDYLSRRFATDAQKLTDLEKNGLIQKSEKTNSYYDRFRNRLMFPIHDPRGQVIAFGGRALADDDKPKYLNSPETLIFSKSGTLYGIYQCRKFTRKIDFILVVEGYMDVVALAQGGITSVVATLGTATTEAHLRILARLAPIIVFCFDGDKAGDAAAWKALNLSLRFLKSGLSIKFLLLPDGEDPDSLVRKESKTAFLKRVENAPSLSQFMFERLKNAVDFATVEGKTNFIETALRLIASVNYRIYQDQLFAHLGEMVGQNPAELRARIESQKSNAQKTPEATDTKTNMDIEISAPVRHMIRIVLNHPQILQGDKIDFQAVQHLAGADLLVRLAAKIHENPDINAAALVHHFQGDAEIYAELKNLMKPLTIALDEHSAKRELTEVLERAKKSRDKENIARLIENSENAENPENEEKIRDRLLRKNPSTSQ